LNRGPHAGSVRPGGKAARRFIAPDSNITQDRNRNPGFRSGSETMKASKEIRVGAFILAAILIVLFIVFSIGGSQKLFGDKVRFNIQFSSTAGLFEGDPVLLTGVEIGNVTRIGFPENLSERKIVVEISVQKDAARRIRRDSRARLGSASIVYGKVVQITMGSRTQEAIPPDDFIPADESSTMSAIVDSTSLVIEGLHSVISKLDRGQGAFSTILNEPLDLRRTLHNLSVASDRLVNILDRIERGKGALGALASDNAGFAKSLTDMQSAAADLKAVASNLRNGEGALGRLINDPRYGRETMNDLRNSVRSLASVTAKIDTGAGTLGLLVNDRELYDGLRDVVVGTKNSKVARWLIQNRRKAGEQERRDAEAEKNDGRNAP
jgi:phospholipid/cholesterol/gamma-HCH transport system substrate-binding protein